MRSKHRRALVACGLLLVASGCAAQDPAGSAGTPDDGHTDHTHAPATFAFGEPADGSLIDRTIEITASDDPFRFEPDSIEVKVGEIIEFEFVNEGGAMHEFILLEEASEDAEAGAHEHTTDPNATARLETGESDTLAWKFTTAGEFVYECHVDGHHLGGMRGTITVSE